MKNFFSSNLVTCRKSLSLTQEKAALSLGLKRNTYANYESEHTQPDIDTILKIASFFGISVDKLLNDDLSKSSFGKEDNKDKKGSKVKVLVEDSVEIRPQKQPNNILNEPVTSYGMPRFITVDSQGEENCLYVPVKARAGYLSGLTDPDIISSLPTYRLPGLNNGSYRIFEIDGHSMFPTFHDKDKAICRAETIDKIRDDRTYVLITKNDGILCKRLINRASQGVIICKSDNNHKGEYPPIVLDVSEILEVWYVTDKWTKQLPSPGEIYKRIIDLEADVIMMKQKLLKQQ